MKKLLALALTLCAATAIPASALAIDADLGANRFQVLIWGARDRLRDAGSWFLEIDNGGVLVPGWGTACEYTVEWVSPTGLVSTDCVLQEMTIHGRRSCLRNGFINFPTLVNLDTSCECAGFDENMLLWDILDICLTESLCGLSGVISYDSPLGVAARGVQIVGGGC